MLPKYLVRHFIFCPPGHRRGHRPRPPRRRNRLLPIVKDLDGAVNSVRGGHPVYRILVTSLSAIAARNGASMIDKLSRGLTVEVVHRRLHWLGLSLS
jgi:uncharacterized protein